MTNALRRTEALVQLGANITELRVDLSYADGPILSSIVSSFRDVPLTHLDHWLDGKLVAASDDMSASRSLGIRISRFGRGVEIVPEEDVGPNQLDETIAYYLIQKQQPRFVLFDNVGYSGSQVRFASACEIASHYLSNGYSGHVMACWGAQRNIATNNAARATLDGRRLVLGWNSRYGGSVQLVEPIIAACEAYGLWPAEEDEDG